MSRKQGKLIGFHVIILNFLPFGEGKSHLGLSFSLVSDHNSLN